MVWPMVVMVVHHGLTAKRRLGIFWQDRISFSTAAAKRMLVFWQF
jgi:hypothetical protein